MVVALEPISSRDSASGHVYLADGKAHDGTDKPRNWFSDGLGCAPETAEVEWRAVRRKWGKDGSHLVMGENGPAMEGEYVQSVHVVLSYDTSEYDPDDLEAVERAHQQSLRTADRLRSGYQVVVKTQTDGRGGKVHGHLLFSSVHPETGLSLSGRHPVRDIQRLRSITNEVAAEFGFDNERLMAERSQRSRLSKLEHDRRVDGEYVWKVDLGERLAKSLDLATTRDEWQAAAAADGVEIRFRGKGASFGFTDRDGQRRDLRASALGTRWRSKNVDQVLDQNAERAKILAAAEAARQPAPRVRRDVPEARRTPRPALDLDAAAEAVRAAARSGADAVPTPPTTSPTPPAPTATTVETSSPPPPKSRSKSRGQSVEDVPAAAPARPRVPTVSKTAIDDHPVWFVQHLRKLDLADRYDRWHSKVPADVPRRAPVEGLEGLPPEAVRWVQTGGDRGIASFARARKEAAHRYRASGRPEGVDESPRQARARISELTAKGERALRAANRQAADRSRSDDYGMSM